MAFIDILRKLHLVKPLPKRQIKVNQDIRAIADFLYNLKYEREKILRLVKEFMELRIEASALHDPELKKKNLRHQINLFDQIIQAYSFFQEDADINGNRIKNIAKVLRKSAIKSEEIDLIDKTNDLKWKFDW